ncbi:MAG: hypothetical protein ICV54_04170 [Nostoc sp. C3-bin3]|nr:hypothetical protein [Nostoc sp. C3-bin3]
MRLLAVQAKEVPEDSTKYIVDIQETFSSFHFFYYSFNLHEQALSSNLTKILFKAFSELNFHDFGKN